MIGSVSKKKPCSFSPESEIAIGRRTETFRSERFRHIMGFSQREQHGLILVHNFRSLACALFYWQPPKASGHD